MKEESTYIGIKKQFLKEFDTLISHFIIHGDIISDKLNPKCFKANIIEGIPDGYEYVLHATNSYRCTNCRASLCETTMKCKHAPSCKNAELRNKTLSLTRSTLFVSENGLIDNSDCKSMESLRKQLEMQIDGDPQENCCELNEIGLFKMIV